MATLAQLRGYVRQLIDEPTQKNFLDANINYSLNRGQEELAKQIVHVYEDYFEKQVQLNPNGTPPGTIPGIELYTLPTDFLKFKRIERQDTGELLPAIDLNEKPVLGNNLPPLVNVAGSAGAFSYYITGNSVGFTPTPTAAIPLLMTYVYRLADLVNDTDVSDVPAEWHNLMAFYAARDAFIQDEADISQVDLLWMRGLAELQQTLRQRQVQEPKHVRRMDVSYMPWLPF